jgi:hypothetical protein
LTYSGQYTANDNGFHANVHFDLQGDGVGTVTNNKYIIFIIENYSVNFAAGVDSTKVINFIITEQGSGKTISLKITLHITVNANGEVTAYVSKFLNYCPWV